MKTLKRTRYYTTNSWNRSTSLAYNLKVYNVIDDDLQDKVFELMESENCYDEINFLIADFDKAHSHIWQAGFNGRSGGYLVLYRGGVNKDGRPFTWPGKGVDDDEVPTQVKRDFRQLAVDIVKTAEYMARHYTVIDEPYQCSKKVAMMG